MTSRRLFADLMRENIKRRLWPIAVAIAGNFFAQIVVALLLASRYESRLAAGSTNFNDVRVNFFRMCGGMTNPLLIMTVLGLALINALQGYSYLFDRRMMDLYGSIPVKRQKLFDVANLNGILIFVIPFTICHLITMAFGLSRYYLVPQFVPQFLMSGVITILMYILNYEVYVLAAALTGHWIVAVLGSAVFGVLFPAIELLRQELTEMFLYSSYNANQGLGAAIISPIGVYTEITSALFYGMDESHQVFFLKDVALYLIASVLATVILYVLARYLVVKRPSESAGKAMAFKATKPFIKIVIEVVVAFYFGILIYVFAEAGNKLCILLGIIPGLLIVHAVMETIYEFDFKASFKHLGSLAISAGICFLIILGFVVDILGFESWQPATARIESAAIVGGPASRGNLYTYRNTNYGYMGYNSGDTEILNKMKLTDIENLEKLTVSGAKFSKEKHLQYILNSEAEDFIPEDGYYEVITVKWNLKNGKEVYREYRVNLDEADNIEAYGKLFESDEYKYGVFPQLTATADSFKSIGGETITENFHKKLSEDEIAEFLECYKKDVLAQTLDDLKRELPSMELYGELDEGWQNYFNLYNFYIFPSYKNTIAFLEAKEIPYDWKQDVGDMSSMRVQNDYNYYEDDGFMWETQDKNEINKTMDNIISEDLFQMNGDLWAKYNGDMDVKHGLMASFTGSNAEGNYETEGVYNYVIFNSKTLPRALKEDCFPSDGDVSVNRGNAGWVDIATPPLYDIDINQ